MKIFEDKKEHESFGVLDIGRATCTPATNLFGSSVNHSNIISLKIHTAVEYRHLSQDSIHQNKCLVEIHLSPVQFAEAITNMNTGGVPCTIKYATGKNMENCPQESKRQIFQKEIENDFRKVAQGIKELKDEADQLLNNPMKAADRKRLKDLLYQINMHIDKNMPFVGQQFQRQLNKSVAEAKGEVDAFFNNKIHQLGIEKLKEEIQKPELVTYYETPPTKFKRKGEQQ